MKNNIVLVCDDACFAQELVSKLLFLRKNDVVSFVTYAESLAGIDFSVFNSVLVMETSSKERTCDLIKFLRKNVNLHILLLTKSYDMEFILQAYENGIDDFALENIDSAELVIRMVKGLKYNAVKSISSRHKKILEQLKVIDEFTGLYTYNYAKLVIENRIDYEFLSKGCFLIISQNNKKPIIPLDKFCSVIKDSVRAEDVVALGNNSDVYVFLPHIDVSDSVSVVMKIQENLGEEFKIYAGITSMVNSFEQMEREALKVLSEIISTGDQYKVFEREVAKVDEWLFEQNNACKNYRFFKQVFDKKLENVIKPVLYRMQKAWEEDLAAIKIDNYVVEDECIFELVHKKQKSRLKITYTGFNKIVVQIIHDGLDSPENEEYSILLSKINQTQLSGIVEKFIKDFKEYVECRK